MNTRSLIKAHRLALTVINFPVLLHWQPAISATDSQLPAAAEAAAAMGEKKGEGFTPFLLFLCAGEKLWHVLSSAHTQKLRQDLAT